MAGQLPEDIRHPQRGASNTAPARPAEGPCAATPESLAELAATRPSAPTPTSPFQPRIFISHSGKDHQFASRLASDLRERLGDPDAVWYDRSPPDQMAAGLVPGDPWMDEILAQLGRRNVFVVVLTPDAVASRWVQEEFRTAWMRPHAEMLIVPVLLKPCQPTEGLGWIELVQYVSFVADDGETEAAAAARYQTAFEELWTAIRLGHTRFLNRLDTPPCDHLERLPVPHYFVDRTDDVAWLRSRLRQPSANSSVCAISGLAGLGKTSVAAQAVRQLHAQGAFPDGIAVALCEEKHNGEHVVPILREVLGRFSYDHRPPEPTDLGLLGDIARKKFAGKRALVVLDNVEPGLPVEQIILPLQAAGVTLLITARFDPPRALVPREACRSLNVLDAEHALELCIKAYGEAKWHQLPPAQQRAGERLVARLEGHTLAIELVGTYAQDFQRDLVQLDRDLADLSNVLNLELPQHMRRPVGVVLTSVYRSLTKDARLLFAGLASFHSLDFGRQAVMALGQFLKISAPRAALDLLVHRKLVQAVLNEQMPVGSDRDRLRLHPLVLEFAITMRRSAADGWSNSKIRAAERAIGQFYAAYVARTSNAALEADAENIHAFLKQAHDRHQDAIVVDICMGLRSYWRTRQLWSEAREFLQWGVDAAERVQAGATNPQDKLRMSSLSLAYAELLQREGDLAAAEQLLTWNLDLRRAMRDRPGEHALLVQLGTLARQQGHVDEADGYFQQALAIATASGDRWNVARDRVHLGHLAVARGQLGPQRVVPRVLVSTVSEDRRDAIRAIVSRLPDPARALLRIQTASETTGYMLESLRE